MLDKTFFKFFLGFTLIIAASFVVLYVANSYGNSAQSATAVRTQ